MMYNVKIRTAGTFECSIEASNEVEAKARAFDEWVNTDFSNLNDLETISASVEANYISNTAHRYL